jgi:hypothetical protein
MFDQILSALHQHAKVTVPPHLPNVTVEPQITIGLQAPEPIVVVEPHFFIMLVPSETFCMLSALIILAII